MTTKEEQAIVVTPAVAKPAPRISGQAIQERKQTIVLLQEMVRSVLLRGVDYGRTPGTQVDGLWDPGASQIIGSFNCYVGERRILKMEDTLEKIAVCLEVPLISRETGQVVATGVGAASTLETKYKYRWVDEPAEWGYEGEAVKGLKTKPGDRWVGPEGARKKEQITLYRIPNPEHSELINTILKMASKRAEVDAAQSLPGVASVLRQMFQGKSGGQGSKGSQGEEEGPVWDRFWGEVARLGFTQLQARQKLGVPSMKVWLAKGRSLDEALDILRGRKTEGPEAPEDENPGEGPDMPGADNPTQQPKAQPATGKPPQRDPATIRSLNDLFRACHDDFGGMQPKDVVKALGYTSQTDISESPSDCYLKIKAAR